MKRRSKKPDWQREIASERIAILFDEAELAFPKRKDLADRYVELARTIAMKYKVRMPKEFKLRFCKHCYKYLRPGVNSRVRIDPDGQRVVVTCLECEKQQRYPYSREKRAKREAANADEKKVKKRRGCKGQR